MQPDHLLRQRAELYASQKAWPQAIASFNALLAQNPHDADIMLQLSYVSSLAGRYREAHAHASAAANAKPTNTAVVQELIGRLRTFNEVPALLDCLERLKPFDRIPIPLLISFASQLTNLNVPEMALELLNEAKRRDSKYPPTLVARGQVLIYLGKFSQAEAELVLCARLAPQITRTWWLLAQLGRSISQQPIAKAIKLELARTGRRPDEVTELAYALHKSLDEIGDYEEAWKALALGYQTKRKLLDYRSQDSAELVEALASMPIFERGKSRNRADSYRGRIPIFIVGLHRSGTTLLEQVMHGHSEVQGLGELYDFTCQMRHATDHHCRGVLDTTLVRRAKGVDFQDIGRGYIDGMHWRLGPEQYFVDKLPSNFFNIGFICQALPEARILHIHRDAMDVCFSNLRELYFDANPWSYDQIELAAFHGHYRRLMNHWHRAFPGRILDIDYSNLVSDPRSTMRRIADYCGLAFEPEMLDIEGHQRPISTASTITARQSISARESPKWAPYADKLAPLTRALKEAQ